MELEEVEGGRTTITRVEKDSSNPTKKDVKCFA
jgi:hypothetical protein